MDLSMIITSLELFNQVQQMNFPSIQSLHILNQPLQYLYEHSVASEEASDQEESLINIHYDSEEEVYVANEYCSTFIIQFCVCFKHPVKGVL